MYLIRIIASMLGVAHDTYSWDKSNIEIINGFKDMFSYEEQIILMNCYIKQKIVTYYTLKNYLKHMNIKKQSITLYRGINVPFDHKTYASCNVESWTASMNSAFIFARESGYVISQEIPINRIFAGKRSTFKNKQHNMYRNNGFYVNREHEYIVEHLEELILLKADQNVHLVMDKEIN